MQKKKLSDVYKLFYLKLDIRSDYKKKVELIFSKGLSQLKWAL